MVVLLWVGIAFVRFGASVAICSFVGRVGPLSGPKFINCCVSDFRYGRHTVFVDPNLRAYVRCAIQSGEKTPILINILRRRHDGLIVLGMLKRDMQESQTYLLCYRIACAS